MYCPNCGTPVAPNQAFCGECGHKLTTKTPENQVASFNEPTADNQKTARPPSYTYPIPQGYLLDSNSGLYYESTFITDPKTQQVVQYVRYFNPQTGQYMDATYSAPGAGGFAVPPRVGATGKQIPQWGWVALIVLFTGLLIFFLASVLGGNEKKPVQGKVGASGEIIQQETYKEYRLRREKELEDEYDKKMEELNKPKSLDEMEPLIKGLDDTTQTQSENTYRILQDKDYYYFSTLRGEDKTYTVSSQPEVEFAQVFPDFYDDLMALKEMKEERKLKEAEEASTPEGDAAPSPEEAVGTEEDAASEVQEEVEVELLDVTSQNFVGNSIYRLPISGGPAEILMTAGEDTLLTGFEISGDVIIYTLMTVDESGFGDPTEMEIWTVELGDSSSHRLITRTSGGPCGMKDGFLYQLDQDNMSLNIWGKDKETGDYVASMNSIDLPYTMTFHMSQLHFEGDELLLIAFDYDKMQAQFINYNVTTKKLNPFYEGEKFYLYRNQVFYNNKLYAIRYEGYHEGYQDVDMGVIDLSSTVPNFQSISTTKNVLWKDRTPFFYVNEEKEELYYKEDDKILKASLNDLSSTVELLTLTSPIVYFSNDMIVFEDGSRYSLKEKDSMETIAYGADASVVGEDMLFGRDPERYLYAVDSADGFKYLDYDLDYTFSFDKSQSPVLNAIMNTAIYFEEEAYFSLYGFEYPEYSRLLLEEPAIASVFITPEGDLDVDNWCRFLYDAVDYAISPDRFIRLVQDGDMEGLTVENDKVIFDPDWVRADRPSVVSYEHSNAEDDYNDYMEYTVNLSDGTTRSMSMLVAQIKESRVSKIQVTNVSWTDPESPSGGYSSESGGDYDDRFGLPPALPIY